MEFNVSGHSKWSTIKHQKGVTDARRGQLFTKLSRDLAVAVRQGTSTDPDLNYSLRLAIDKAKSNNMPMDTIERSIKRASGEGDGAERLDGVVYEGYGPGGVAIMLYAVTPNRNRTASEVRSTFSKCGGNLGETGCVGWNFEPKGIIILQVEPMRTEEIALRAIDAGAEDVQIEDDYLEVYTSPEHLESIRKEIGTLDVEVSSSEFSMRPKSTVALGDKEAAQVLKLMDSLEDLIDVQKVYTNSEFSSAALEKYKG